MGQKPVKVITASELEENGGIYELQGGAAIRVRGSSSGGSINGGALTPVYVVSDADVSSGRFKVIGGFTELVSDEITTRPVSGFVAIPVWAINGDEWPSSAFAPTDVSGCSLWVDSTDSSTWYQDDALTIPAVLNDPIGGWEDKSGNDNHGTQSVSGNRPTITSSGVGYSSGDSLDVSGLSGTAYAIYTAMSPNVNTDSTSFSRPIVHYGSGGADAIWLGSITGSYTDELITYFPTCAHESNTDVILSADNHIIGIRYDSVRNQIFWNNNTINLAEIGNGSPRTFSGFLLGSSSGVDMRGDLLEVICYTEEVSLSDHLAITNYLNDKYGAY